MSNILAKLADKSCLKWKFIRTHYLMSKFASKKRQPSKQCACEEWILYIEKPNNKPANSAKKKKKINNQQPSSLDFSLDTHSLATKWLKRIRKIPLISNGIVFVSDVNFKTNGAKCVFFFVCLCEWECNTLCITIKTIMLMMNPSQAKPSQTLFLYTK